MLPHVMLTGSGPVLSSSIELQPGEKMRLIPDVRQRVHRIKNCCGKVNLSYYFQITYWLRNDDPQNVFVAEEGTFLSAIVSHPTISTYVRRIGPPAAAAAAPQPPSEKQPVDNTADDTDDTTDDEIFQCQQCLHPSSSSDNNDGQWLYITPCAWTYTVV